MHKPEPIPADTATVSAMVEFFRRNDPNGNWPMLAARATTHRYLAERVAAAMSDSKDYRALLARTDEPAELPGFGEEQLQAIDASVFSGDCYASAEGKARLVYFIGRWLRELNPLRPD